MTLSPLEISLLAAFLGCICGVAGGYGGCKLFARSVARELGEVGADLESFDLRIKKLEGRKVREQQLQQREAPPPELAAFLAAAGGKPQLVQQPHQETETDIINRAFPPVRKAE